MMRERAMPKETYILTDRKEAMDRYHSFTNPRDVWNVYLQTGKQVWVETGPATHTVRERKTAEKKAIAAVQIETGEQVHTIEYDP